MTNKHKEKMEYGDRMYHLGKRRVAISFKGDINKLITHAQELSGADETRSYLFDLSHRLSQTLKM